MIEPGDPYVTMSGTYFPVSKNADEMNSQPMISVMNYGSAFSFASHLRQS